MYAMLLWGNLSQIHWIRRIRDMWDFLRSVSWWSVYDQLMLDFYRFLGLGLRWQIESTLVDHFDRGQGDTSPGTSTIFHHQWSFTPASRTWQATLYRQLKQCLSVRHWTAWGCWACLSPISWFSYCVWAVLKTAIDIGGYIMGQYYNIY